MASQDFMHGPFCFERSQQITNRCYWAMKYGTEWLAEKAISDTATKSQIIEEFYEVRGAFIRSHQPAPKPIEYERLHIARLVTPTDRSGVEDQTLDSFPYMTEIQGLSRGLINDLAESWLVISSLDAIAPMGHQEFERLKVAHTRIYELEQELERLKKPVPEHHHRWISSLLPDSVLTDNAEDWRPPTAWELRHIVGEGSFTGQSGAKVAEMVGITPQGFRKYTANESAKNRQAISFAMWHLLLHKLGIQKLKVFD